MLLYSKLKTTTLFALFAAFHSFAAEQELLITTEFLLKAGAAQSRIFTINTPAHVDHLVMVGFNPVKALAIDCQLSLYTSAGARLGSYNCGERQSYQVKLPAPAATQFEARIEVSNNNFTAATTSFSVINRFKFVSATR